MNRRSLVGIAACHEHESTERSNPCDECLLDVRSAARMLNVTVSWVYEHIGDGARDRVPHVRLGKYVRFHPSDLRDYIDAKRRSGGARRC